MKRRDARHRGRQQLSTTIPSSLRQTTIPSSLRHEKESHMPHVRKWFTTTTLLAVTAVVVGGVIASSAFSAATRPGAASQTGCTKSSGTLKYGIAGAGIAQLDPNTISFAGQFPLQFTLYNGLTKYAKDNEVVGDLATSWYVRNNLKNWYFNLRKGVRYSTGRAFTANDVRANILRVLDPKVTSQQKANAKDIRSVRVLSPTKLVIRLGHPSALLPAALVDIKMSDTQNVSTLATSGTGTGPYKVASFVPNQSLALIPNQYHFGGRACLQRIEFVREPDPTAMVTDFKAGNLDVIWQVRPSDTETVRQAGSILKPLGGV
ncbi:MAG: ABC transporter substrate-binding protein, partial [Thermoleophilia bacterium]|nr:ABC transporter substrate-binding protein [Thermoleophilia bacterium]